MIYYALAVVAALVAIFLLALLAMQFWRLGQYLKLKHPIVFRLYAAVWFFLGIIAALGAVTGFLSLANDYRKEQRRLAVEAILTAPGSGVSSQELALIKAAQSEYCYSPEQFFYLLKMPITKTITNKTAIAIEKAHSQGFTYNEIATAFGIYYLLSDKNQDVSSPKGSANQFNGECTNTNRIFYGSQYYLTPDRKINEVMKNLKSVEDDPLERLLKDSAKE
ncbi:hypothetical protein [Aquirhabdus parva]|uniref:Uncharacterized protein n=1 Tax=Aquirhabdus parva TaxID=2283318 RepID=A0A345P8S1_9GAMM|nr:hypothetical protein [Aquirhabdus parva]AXI03680.1 hypothetical protein HYN46_13085 [Aquirhabdus parva]